MVFGDVDDVVCARLCAVGGSVVSLLVASW